MSDDTPEPTVALPDEAGEQLLVPAPPTRVRRRGRIAAAVAVVLVLALGGGAWAVWSWLDGGGPQPDDALPASTVALVSLDLDPSAGQKIEAFKTLRKFPALKKNLGLSSRDDLRKYVVDEIVDSSGCDLSYDDDVKPWIGDRVGIAAVDLGNGEPAPAIAIAVGDKARATSGFKALARCADLGSDVGFVVDPDVDYLIASDTPEHAEQIAEAARKHPLSEDPAYQRWTGKVGDRGVLSFYVSSKAVSLLASVLSDRLDSSTEGSFLAGRGFGTGLVRPSAAQAEACSDLGKELEEQAGASGFQGLAGTLRFSDGGLELSAVAGSGTGAATPDALGSRLTGLPKDTSATLAMAPGKDLAQQWTTGTRLGSCGTAGGLLDDLGSSTGLRLPDDLVTLLGGGLSLSVGKVSADLDGIEDPADLPVGLLVHGDSAAIEDVIHRIESHVGGSLSEAGVETKSKVGAVALSPSQSYTDELLETGSLGRQSRFREVVPEADKASFALFLDFDSPLRKAVKNLLAEDSRSGATTFEDNTEPLESLGASTWTDGSGTHFLLKIATD